MLLVPLLGALAGAFALELGVRIYFYPGAPDRHFDTTSPAESRRWVPNPFVPYAGRANATFDLKNDDGTRELITTNSYGFRAHAFPAEKKPGDYVVLCFGESSTYGFKTPTNALTWPERLEHRLQGRYPDRRVRVFNLGVDMASSAFSIVNLSLVGVHLQPDLIISYHGCNDTAVLNVANYRWDHSHAYRDLSPDAGVGYQARTPSWLRWSQALFVATGSLDLYLHTNDLYAAARNPVEPASSLLPELEAMLVNYQTLHSLAVGSGSEIIFSTFQFRDGDDPGARHFNQALRSLFASRNWPYVDQDALLPNRDPTINIDSCHFTQKGNELMAQNFFEHIVSRGLLDAEHVR